jgi:diguanylate cyclase (GGDEF)-like protein
MFEFLRDVLYCPHRAKLDVNALPEDFRDLGEGLIVLASMLNEARDFARQLSRGDLNGDLPGSDNELASNLKALHATLRHLTWQTQRVAGGDYNQKIDFMGDFSEAFNTMIAQLRERHENQLAEIEIIQKKTQDLARSNSLFRAITSNMSEWIVMIDRETGEHLFANHPVKNDLASDIFEAQLYNILFEFSREIGDDVECKEEEFPLISDFAVQYFSVMLYPIRWYEHNAVACVLTDISAEKEQIKELENVAYRDMLTGAYNRHFGMKLLNEWIEQQIHFAICFVDMDRLKYVNDVFGHTEGDQYILSVSELLSCFPGDPYVCRLGGDEFMLLVPGVALADAEAKMEALREELTHKEYVSEKNDAAYRRSISFGVVESPADGSVSSGDLLSAADEKMYEYKKSHKAERRDAPQ